MTNNCHRDKWCSPDHQMRKTPPNKITTQFVEWIAIEDQGQVPVWRLYRAHQRRVLRPSLYKRPIAVGCTDVQSRFDLRAPTFDPESSCTKSTSQSAQCVNPGRYSALHSGQNMGESESTISAHCLINAESLTRSTVASVFSPGVGLLRRHPSASF